MPTNQSFEWELSVLGGHSAYPGHPIVLGCMIMDRYQNLEHANRVEEGEQFPNASADSFIPGAGCAVSTALAVLKLAENEGVGPAYDLAARYWDGYDKQSTKNAGDVAMGLAQFAAIKPRFEEHLAKWGTAHAAPSEFRLVDMPSDQAPRAKKSRAKP
jgi:hypothetical protein